MHAPIAVFAFNRPAHVERLLRSLECSPMLNDSPVRIYCDGPKLPEQEDSVIETRRIVAANTPPGAEIIERDENFGLARSIITGVTELCAEHGRVIVLEDDLVLSPHALGFLNGALERYADVEKVMHVSAYMFPVKADLPPAFFYREATCWGWATWARAWKHFEPDAGKLVTEIDERGVRRQFNLDESMFFYQMLYKQRDGELDSWAIRWYASMFRRGGLALHPGRSLVENLGFDGSGVHCNVDSRFEVQMAKEPVNRFPDEMEECKAAVRAMMAYRRRVFGEQNRVRAWLRRMVPDFSR